MLAIDDLSIRLWCTCERASIHLDGVRHQSLRAQMADYQASSPKSLRPKSKGLAHFHLNESHCGSSFSLDAVHASAFPLMSYLPHELKKLAETQVRRHEPLVTLATSTVERVCVVELNYPQHFNAIEFELVSDLVDALLFFGRMPNVVSLVLEGNGPHFCIGAYPYAEADEVSASSVNQLVFMSRGISCLRRHPVVSAVHGILVGGGIALCTSTSVMCAPSFQASPLVAV